MVETAAFSKTLNYTYNDRDWLTDINDISSTAEPFATQYDYFDDGNIKTAIFYNSTSGLPSEKKFKYDFTYDKRKQILSANYFYDFSGSWQNAANFDLSGITYDDNGNLLTLKRFDEVGFQGDNLDYEYDDNNRLQELVENESPTGPDWDAEDSDYTYDANGSVIAMTEKK